MKGWFRNVSVPPNKEKEFSTHRNFTIVLGSGFRAGAVRRFGIRKKDSNRHVYIVGKTGTGKSGLIRNVCIQLIRRNQGVTVIDPHGDLTEELLAAVPKSRLNDCIHISLADREFPVQFNPLIGKIVGDKASRAASITRAFRNIWSDSWGPRTQYILQHAFLSLLYVPQVTLLDMERLFRDEGFRSRVISLSDVDVAVRAFWRTYESWTERYRIEAVGPVQNKIGQLLMNSSLRNVLCSPRRRFDASTAINKGRIVLVNLAKGIVGHEAVNLFGSLLVAEYEEAALSRGAVPVEQRRHHWLVIDEFQSLTTETFAGILSEIRKYHLHVWLANQYLDQINPIVRSSILGNVGSFIVFQTGAQDARVIGDEFGWSQGYSSLVELNRFEVAVKLMAKGETQLPFIGKTMTPLPTPYTYAAQIINANHNAYCGRREQVEDWIWKRKA